MQKPSTGIAVGSSDRSNHGGTSAAHLLCRPRLPGRPPAPHALMDCPYGRLHLRDLSRVRRRILFHPDSLGDYPQPAVLLKFPAIAANEHFPVVHLFHPFRPTEARHVSDRPFGVCVYSLDLSIRSFGQSFQRTQYDPYGGVGLGRKVMVNKWMLLKRKYLLVLQRPETKFHLHVVIEYDGVFE